MQVMRHRRLTGRREEPDWEVADTHYRLSDSWLDAASNRVVRPAFIGYNVLSGEDVMLPCGLTVEKRWGAKPDGDSEDVYEDPWNGDDDHSQCETSEVEERRDRRCSPVLPVLPA